MDFDGRRDREGPKRGLLTGPNPTDRGKKGTKRHVLTDANGIPVAVGITAANVNDVTVAELVVDSVVVAVPRGIRRPDNLCLDKGYDSAPLDRALRDRGITPHIRKRGENALLGISKGKPRRWVVERTNSWHNRFRGLLIRWERKPENYFAMVCLGSALIAFQQAQG